MRGRVVFSLLVTGLLAASHAFAQSAPSNVDADASATIDVASLEREIATSFDDQTKALAVEDCAVACRALASIQRATSKLCELDPGARCVSARSKLDVAAQRVREACPQCGLALAPPSPAPEERAMATSSPETVHGRGGCGGCTMTSTSVGDRGAAALLGLGGVFVLARRRRRGRDSR